MLAPETKERDVSPSISGSPIRAESERSSVSALGWASVAGILAYVVLTVTAQLLPPHYSPIHQAESDLAVGPYGYLMTLAFVVRGLLSFALLAAINRGVPRAARSRTGLTFLGIWAAGAIIIAAFPTDVKQGQHTLHGGIHYVVALVAFISVAVAESILASRFSHTTWPELNKQIVKALSYWTDFTLILFLLMARRPRIFGLFERLFLSAALLWILVVALQLALGATRARQARE